MFTLLGITIELLRKKKPDTKWLNQPPVLRTVGEEYGYKPHDGSEEGKNKASQDFDEWAQYVKASTQYTPDPHLAKESTIVKFKH